jgi:carbonic anhydrase
MPEFRRLLDGYRRFREQGWAEKRDRWTELRQGQAPHLSIRARSL